LETYFYNCFVGNSPWCLFSCWLHWR